MFELKRAGEKTWYIDGPTKIGIYETQDGVYLIDSGNDKDAGRKIRQVLEKQNWQLKGILNTHSNADHIGGNHYLQNQTGCFVFSSGLEKSFIQYPLLETSFLYGGFPCDDLRHKFLFAQESDPVDFSHPAFPKEVEVIPLPGHFFHMTGFRMPDGTVFLGDSLCSRATLDKYGVTFVYDVAAYLETLHLVENMQAQLFIPSHAEATADIRELAQYNRQKVLEVADLLLNFCSAPIIFEEVLQKVFSHYGLFLSFQQYVLVGSTIRSYLAWLKDEGKLSVTFTDNRMLWQRI